MFSKNPTLYLGLGEHKRAYENYGTQDQNAGRPGIQRERTRPHSREELPHGRREVPERAQGPVTLTPCSPGPEAGLRAELERVGLGAEGAQDSPSGGRTVW